MVNKSPLSYDSSRTSVKIVGSERHMQMYDLTENEISTISAWNTQSTIVFSIGSFLLSQALSIILGISATKEGVTRTPIESVLCTYVMPTCFLIAVGCFILGGYLLWSRKSILTVVKNETKAKSEPKG